MMCHKYFDFDFETSLELYISFSTAFISYIDEIKNKSSNGL